jgi:hypothetical protein
MAGRAQAAPGFFCAASRYLASFGLWHAPVNLAGYNYPQAPVLGALVLFPIQLIAVSFIMIWLIPRARSLWPAVFLDVIEKVRVRESHRQMGWPSRSMYCARLRRRRRVSVGITLARSGCFRRFFASHAKDGNVSLRAEASRWTHGFARSLRSRMTSYKRSPRRP